ncbi:MAG: fused response regulator/phosphatase [Pseudophaeobacter sp. bin_em_oilr2.035]|uniref:Fused response regulator/phosphatase n=2 Tax=Phaeobacter gallaeciensis TaxID=60890 RepID=A0ABD4X9N4_9RHOB|nr:MULTISPECIES: fused response regulator/phosphatase [Phaeobacter]MDF1773719.1 fused response regulator/phosphatase [Pseudophaeobacter sp. bin_em_oilr2.035]MDE4062404.1 fused response regulator/phosphatase [Phaeobacter gallaeciensis]MDE4099239.1 fused response regulator/phosphatase [Phaeobacter gallaeciensis]MDE4108132.1 fused response regulator/phosphatase [Phaeobacter gallaeciensis]MDE4112503.1 fused response regulator/phosphatase [Phaeobacter gallaeciensis]
MLPDSPVDHEEDAMSGSINRVLVVDDSRLQRRILVASLKKWGFDVLEAEGGEQAMEICRNDPPDLILSDWMMPGMNGIEFCREFRAQGTDKYSYFILLTSKSEKNEVAEGLDAGADDFLTKPVSSDELRARISAGERILRMQRELSEKNRIVSETLGELQRVYDAIDKDLIQARKIQESLVPELSKSFGSSTVSLLLKPCGHIGGDLVGMFCPGVNRIGFYSIDVSGHGITSAMMTARLGGYLSSTYFDQNVGMEKRFNRFYALRQPEEVASMLNARLIADTGIEEYFTMAYCIVDLRSGVLKMVQAGHPHPLLLRKDGTAEFIGKGGVPVGLVPDIGYSQEEIVMEKGDRLLLYSDGFTEARLESGEMLEAEGLLELIRKCDSSQSGKEFLDDLYWNLTQILSPEHGLEDDVSATLFEYEGP